MPNGNNGPWHESVPVWAKTLVFLAGTLGVPVLTSAYFMAQNAGVIGSPALRNEASLGRLEVTLSHAVKSMYERVDRRDKTQEYLLQVQVQTCRNAARTEQQTRDCDYWKR